MPHTFDIKGIDGYHDSEYCSPPWDETWHPVTSALVFCSTWVGMYEITEANHEKFFRRAYIEFLTTGISGLISNETHKPVPFRLKDIRDHIGLRTNASPMNESEFKKRTMRGIEGPDDYREKMWLKFKKQAAEALVTEKEKCNG